MAPKLEENACFLHSCIYHSNQVLHFVVPGASQSHQMQSPAYTYALYDPSQTTPGTMYASQSQQHHSMYPQGVLYVPAVHPVTGASPSAMSSEQDSGGMEFQPIESPTGEGETPNRAPGAHERESESTSDQDNSGN